MAADVVDPKDPLLVASLDLLRRSGAKTVQIRYDDDPKPTVWVVDAEFRQGRDCAGALTPARAAFRLLEQILDGVGKCAHCGRPSGVTEDWREEMPMAHVFCWYVFDPETEKFRRSCEGETTGRVFGVDGDGNTVSRNDPCPCGSGKKWKRCHGWGG